ncbi:hypothetical protein PGT21_008013 [Puccinia graminis f. sp. tritici]|uniref:Uncharacterized protein n=1 Tax=Puccinia graminis f. sp. tritici TaxID=56615 RepID=A0A5B0QAB3_PUCGR|nr:hypothetical protein PGT21_008013 [Puccinia graminis f. sp. tritici]
MVSFKLVQFISIVVFASTCMDTQAGLVTRAAPAPKANDGVSLDPTDVPGGKNANINSKNPKLPASAVPVGSPKNPKSATPSEGKTDPKNPKSAAGNGMPGGNSKTSEPLKNHSPEEVKALMDKLKLKPNSTGAPGAGNGTPDQNPKSKTKAGGGSGTPPAGPGKTSKPNGMTRRAEAASKSAEDKKASFMEKLKAKSSADTKAGLVTRATPVPKANESATPSQGSTGKTDPKNPKSTPGMPGGNNKTPEPLKNHSPEEIKALMDKLKLKPNSTGAPGAGSSTPENPKSKSKAGGGSGTPPAGPGKTSKPNAMTRRAEAATKSAEDKKASFMEKLKAKSSASGRPAGTPPAELTKRADAPGGGSDDKKAAFLEKLKAKKAGGGGLSKGGEGGAGAMGAKSPMSKRADSPSGAPEEKKAGGLLDKLKSKLSAADHSKGDAGHSNGDAGHLKGDAKPSKGDAGHDTGAVEKTAKPLGISKRAEHLSSGNAVWKREDGASASDEKSKKASPEEPAETNKPKEAKSAKAPKDKAPKDKAPKDKANP